MGTVKPRNPSNVLDILTSQHSEVDKLLATLEKQGKDRTVFLELANKLAAHAACEEKVFYPAVMTGKTSDMLHESVEEHLEIKRLLADMIEQDLDEDEFAAKLNVLKENVSHHAHEEEEDKLFPMLRKAMSEDELAAIGSEYLAMFEALLPTDPYKHVPSETAEAAPLPRT
ncbi:MAG TPA: hemerythrin domain-containing protein [Kofleriaceae bacterium]|jgi:hemerythrin superfamily protein